MNFLILAVLLAVGSLGPGMLALRRFKWDPLEKLCAAMGVSFLMLFLWAWSGALIGFLPLFAALWSLAAVVMTLLARREIAALWWDQGVRKAAIGWAGLFVWSLALQALLRHYGGADWSGDWYEHYQRAVYFTLWPFDRSFEFIELYLLPARPPLMNVISASLMAQIGSAFFDFQVVMTFLNSLVYFPLLALARLLGGRNRALPWILAIVLAVSPLFCQNVTYTWTRLFAGFFVVLGLVLYIASWRTGDATRMIASFSALAAGFLTHYSVGPYLVFLAAHYLLVLWRRRVRPMRELFLIVVAGALILSSWFVWSILTFGTEGTFASNTSVTESRKLTRSENLVKMLTNTERTFVPFVFHRSLPEDRQRFAPGVVLRDTTFLLYQNNFILALGSLNWIVVVVLLWRGLRPKTYREEPPPRAFWAWGIIVVIVLGIAVHGGPSEWGLAHICLQPLVLMLLALLASRFAVLEVPLKVMVVVGVCIDATLGIILHFFLLRSNIDPGLGTITTFNWQIKQRVGLVFLGDLLASWVAVLQVGIVTGVVVMVVTLAVVGWRTRKTG